MGASLGAKFVIDCAAPSSVMRKFSFFSPGKKFPLLSVITTSTVTTGTVTEIEKPPGVCSAGAFGCCLSFACAHARISPAGNSSVKMSVSRTNTRKKLVRMVW